MAICSMGCAMSAAQIRPSMPTRCAARRATVPGRVATSSICSLGRSPTSSRSRSAQGSKSLGTRNSSQAFGTEGFVNWNRVASVMRQSPALICASRNIPDPIRHTALAVGVGIDRFGRGELDPGLAGGAIWWNRWARTVASAHRRTNKMALGSIMCWVQRRRELTLAPPWQ